MLNGSLEEQFWSSDKARDEERAKNTLNQISNQYESEYKWTSINYERVNITKDSIKKISKVTGQNIPLKKPSRTIDENRPLPFKRQGTSKTKLPLVLSKKIIFSQDDDPFARKPNKLNNLNVNRKGSRNHFSVKQLSNHENGTQLGTQIFSSIFSQYQKDPVSSYLKPSQFFTGDSDEKEQEDWEVIKNLVRQRRITNSSLKVMIKYNNRHSEINLKRLPLVVKSMHNNEREKEFTLNRQGSSRIWNPVNSTKIQSPRKIGSIPINITRGQDFQDAKRFSEHLKTYQDNPSSEFET